MNQEDIELLIMANEPISVGNIKVYPMSIREIAKFGYVKYNQAINIFCMPESEIHKLVGGNIFSMEFLRMNTVFDEGIRAMIKDFLSLVCKTKVTYSEKDYSFIVGGEPIDKGNIDELKSIIRKINCTEETDSESTENPSNARARQLLEKRRKLRNKIIKHQKENNLLKVHEIVSAVAVSQKMSINQVMDYNLYQLMDQFVRLISKETYETNMEALLHGADSKNIEITHWIQNKKSN